MRNEVAGIVEAIAAAPTWDARVALIRRIPEAFGTADRPVLYSSVAGAVFVPRLTPDFAFIHWRDEYELEPFREIYEEANRLTSRFRNVDVASLATTIAALPETLKVFRTILGFTPQEFAAASGMVAEVVDTAAISTSRVKAIEAGRRLHPGEDSACAELIDRAMTHRLFLASSEELRPRIDKPDTGMGWDSVRAAVDDGVPYPVLLHQRLYGGAFRTLLDATSTQRGDILEDAVEGVLRAHRVPYVRTGPANQEEIARRFQITVRPAPDFVMFDGTETLRAILECKVANDGGTARDKAARYGALRIESQRLGGVPVFAVLSGLGWRRTGDALGPVVEATDGRVFTLATLNEITTVQPMPGLVRLSE